MSSSLVIRVLNDNLAGFKCGAEWGLSFLIEADVQLLFDAGPSDIAIRNARILGLDLEKVPFVVLSHGHYDHGDGLKHLHGQTLVCHPAVFTRRFSKEDNEYSGIALQEEEAQRRFNLVLSKSPHAISNSVTFLGEIPRLNDFEARTCHWYDEGGNDDFVPDDSAIVIKLATGIVVVAGCSHSGICNIVDYAMQIAGVSDVLAVIGGFHLFQCDEQLEKTVRYFEHIKVKRVIPCHCTGFEALSRLKQRFEFNQTRSGDIITIL